MLLAVPVELSPQADSKADADGAVDEDASGTTCDVCGRPVDVDDEEQMTGSGLYVWVRGDKVVYEEPPLCASCGTAISMTALGRWEIEEEEG
jgi:hypothetical protein